VRDILWTRHPAVRTGDQLTKGERAADVIRNGMGSWPFVAAFAAVLVGWMVLNSHLVLGARGGHPFDRFPWILLNLALSCLAAIQGAILLIAARRADQISSELAQHTYQIDQQTLDLAEQLAARTEEDLQLTREVKELTEQVRKLTLAMHAHLGCERPEPTVTSEQVWLTELQRLG
jgi:uncharacterized membrane protein